MSDAAQFEPLNHEVFQKPFPVQPAFQMWPTPENYRRSPAGKELPPKIKVWRVQNSGKDYGSVVSIGAGYNDSPDAEVLAQGYNTGKQFGDVGVGRHASFLQWGYSSPPSQMTAAGRALFLNCICYIRKFDGVAPLVHCLLSGRSYVVTLASFIDGIKDPAKTFAGTFPPELLGQYLGKHDAFAKYFQDNLELVYYDKGYRVDDDLKSAGIPSNRTVAALGQMIALLKDARTAPKGRLLLRRYTLAGFATPEQWQAWFDANQDIIYFSDVGGYKFRIIPAK
jgi:hypothetical protein